MGQIIGIPVGTTCGPGLANSYLYGYESKFIDNLCLTDRIVTAKRFHTSFRLIDDTLSVEFFGEKQSAFGQILPKGLLKIVGFILGR